MAELPIWQYDTLFLITVVLFGVTALTMQNLMSAAIVEKNRARSCCVSVSVCVRVRMCARACVCTYACRC